nr:integrase DNA-binding domain-containing protein [[Ruminococcus] torques]
MAKAGRGQTRRDSKRRVLRPGESVRADRKYQYKYHIDGKPHFVYSWKLEPTDKLPKGKKPCLSLRELEKQVNTDLELLVNIVDGQMTVCELVDRYLKTKTGVRQSTKQGYVTVQRLLAKETFGKKTIRSVKTSDAKLFLIKLQQEDGKSYSSIHTIRGVLRPAFQMAVDDDILVKNPFGFQLAGVLVNDAVTREVIYKDQINYAFDDNSNAFKLAGSVLEALTGRNINGIIENLKSDNPLTKIKEEKDLHENIKNFFTELLVERGNRLVVFIDELDRCKPSYAVQLLERIKHYLYDDRITFVFSVNLGELQHTIKHYYGNTFDACRYLDRFFDMRISLPPADKTAFYREMGLESSYVLEKICRKVIDTYNMELREATRFYRQVKTAAYEPTHESRKFDFSFSDEKGRQLLLMYVVPILVGLKIVDISLYNQFVCGKSSKPLMDIYKDSDKGEWLATRLLNRNEAFEVEEGKSVVTVEQKIQQLYDAIFVTEYTGNVYHTILGEYEFDDNSKNFVKSVESMLSVYADYNI